VNLDTVTRRKSRAGSRARCCCSTARCSPAATPRTSASPTCSTKGEKLPVDFTNRFIYYVGPVDPVRDEVVGPAGPTTATRMDKFTSMMLEKTGLLGMVGKAERGPVAIEAIKRQQGGILMAVGGAAYLVSKAIKAPRSSGLRRPRHGSDLRIRRAGHAGHGRGRFQGHLGAQTGPKEWQAKIGKIPVKSVEMLQLDDPALATDVRARIDPLLERGVDRIVLGCTHYSFLAPLLGRVIGTRAQLVDVAEAVARQTRRLAADRAHGSGRLLLQASAHPERLHAALPRLRLGHIAARVA
jgi:hypothetical protein